MNLKYPISMFLIFINYWIANSDETHEKRKTKELWKILEQKEVSETEEKRLGYTSAADLIIEYPKQADKIAEWITKNPGSDEDEPTILKKPRFEAIMQSDTLIPAEDLEQAKEVEKLWKIIELKDIVGSKEVGLTTRTHVLSVLPDHTEKIFEWIEKNPGSIKDELFKITKPEFKELIHCLTLYPENESERALTLKKLQKLNKRLEDEPQTFLD